MYFLTSMPIITYCLFPFLSNTVFVDFIFMCLYVYVLLMPNAVLIPCYFNSPLLLWLHCSKCCSPNAPHIILLWCLHLSTFLTYIFQILKKNSCIIHPYFHMLRLGYSKTQVQYIKTCALQTNFWNKLYYSWWSCCHLSLTKSNMENRNCFLPDTKVSV